MALCDLRGCKFVMPLGLTAESSQQRVYGASLFLLVSCSTLRRAFAQPAPIVAIQIALATANFIVQHESVIFCKWHGCKSERIVHRLTANASCQAEGQYVRVIRSSELIIDRSRQSRPSY